METLETKQTDTNILKFKKRKRLNIGIVIFGIIFIYLVATVIMYIVAPHITVYEVRQGSILKDNAYTGIALRDEIVVNATESGYVNYYTPNASKVRLGSKVYTLSDQPLNLSSENSQEDLELTSEEKRTIMMRIQNYNHDYNENSFDSSYQLKAELKNTLTNMRHENTTSQLDYILSQTNMSGINIYNSFEDGIVVYSVDGMETLTTESASIAHLDKTNYKKTEFSNNSKISAGSPVYKLVTNENWTVMIEIDSETANVLREKNYVKVHFSKDDQIVWASLELDTIGSHYVAYLHFENAMIRYATDRYLDIELILEDETGLKIPKTAETKKDFYVVPKEYLTQGGNSSDYGVLVETTDSTGKSIIEFKEVNIYHETGDVVYLDPNAFEKNSVIRQPESSAAIMLNETDSLKGVFCINKGYAVFKQIHILCESDAYYIVEEGNRYGLSNYDHIALDSTNIKENDVVF